MGDHSEITWLRIPRRLSVLCAIALAGCVPHSAELSSRSDPIHAAGVAGSDGQTCRPSPALLVPPSAPDCAFRRSAMKTIDPGEFSRLKIEYEIKCYQKAEQTVRQRLKLLQAANRCQIASARQ